MQKQSELAQTVRTLATQVKDSNARVSAKLDALNVQISNLGDNVTTDLQAAFDDLTSAVQDYGKIVPVDDSTNIGVLQGPDATAPAAAQTGATA